MSAPERIWANPYYGMVEGGTSGIWKLNNISGRGTEYVRADLRTPDPRVLALVEALRDARSDLAAYVEADWPEASRIQYPPLQAKWKRDMELCWRIDAALAAWEA